MDVSCPMKSTNVASGHSLPFAMIKYMFFMMSGILSLQGRTAIVTGSSSGQGRAIALALASEGANVVCSDLNSELGETAYEENKTPTHELIAQKGRAIFQRADVSNEDDVKALIEMTVKTYGRIDILVNNAGIWLPSGPIAEETLDTYEKIMSINVRGYFLCMKYAIKQMLAQVPLPSGDRGVGLNISSTAANVGMPNSPAYSASKAAVLGLTKSAALDYAKQRIRVNAICPGTIQTGMVRGALENETMNAWIKQNVPWPRLGQPEDVGKAALFLCSDASSWTTGSVLTIDGGSQCG